MKLALTLIFTLVTLEMAGQPINFDKGYLSSNEVDRITRVIYKIENSQKYPYGIKSIHIKGWTEASRKEYARRICFNTVTNNYSRWLKADKPGEFLDYLANKYCPPSDDKIGNKNWKKNIKSQLN